MPPLHKRKPPSAGLRISPSVAAAVLAFVAGVAPAATPPEKARRFFTVTARGASVTVRQFEVRSGAVATPEIRRERTLETSGGKAPSEDATYSLDATLSPSDEWLAVSVTRDADNQNTLVVLDAGDLTPVFQVRGAGFTPAVPWLGRRTLLAARKAAKGPDGDLYHAYAYSAPRWADSERRVSKRATRVPYPFEEIRRFYHDVPAKAVERGLVALKASSLRPPPPGDGYASWANVLRGELGSVSRAGDAVAALAGGAALSDYKLVLLQREPSREWRVDTLMVGVVPHHVRLWGGWVVVGTRGANGEETLRFFSRETAREAFALPGQFFVGAHAGA